MAHPVSRKMQAMPSSGVADLPTGSTRAAIERRATSANGSPTFRHGDPVPDTIITRIASRTWCALRGERIVPTRRLGRCRLWYRQQYSKTGAINQVPVQSGYHICRISSCEGTHMTLHPEDRTPGQPGATDIPRSLPPRHTR